MQLWFTTHLFILDEHLVPSYVSINFSPLLMVYLQWNSSIYINSFISGLKSLSSKLDNCIFRFYNNWLLTQN
jgi:hypothetical protein